MIIVNLAQIFIIISLGFIITIISAKIFSLTLQRAIILFIWHTFFSFAYAWYVSKFGGDANSYYNSAQDENYLFGFSTAFIVFISSFLLDFVNLSFISMNIIFGIFGVIGLFAFDSSLRFVTKDANKKFKLLATIIVFLPSVSFWSSGLGKDSISFMAINLILWACFNLRNRKLIFIIGITSLFLVRPHIAIILFFSFIATLILNNNLKIFNRIVLFTIFLIIGLSVLPIGLEIVGFRKDLTFKNILIFIENRQNYNWKSWAGGIDIRDMSLLAKLFTYLFRPLPFEAHSFTAFLASLENIFLLYLFVLGLIAMLNNKGVVANPDLNTLFFLIYSITTLLLFSNITANLGIAVRQKWMFLPFLTVLFISYNAQNKGKHKKVINFKNKKQI